jgi:hypothetical protein
MSQVKAKADAVWPSAEVRRGLVRTCFALVICWLLVLSAIALHAHLSAEEALQNLRASDRDLTTATVRNTEAVTGRERLKQVLYEQSQRAHAESLKRRDLALIGLPMLPVALLIVWAAFLWIVPGLRSRLRTKV